MKWEAIDMALHVVVLIILIPLLMPLFHQGLVELLSGVVFIAAVLLVLEIIIEKIIRKK